MGNQQSTANHNRLSKPKTNTNSPSPALKADSPVSVSSRYADLSARGRQQIRENLLSPAHTEFGSAIWSNKDDGVVETITHTRGRPLSVISRSNSRANSRTNSRSNSLSCFGSRHGSSTKLAGLGDSKVSLVSTAQVDLEAAIKLLQEVKRNASPEDVAALQQALEPFEEHAVPVAEQELSQRNLVINRSSSSLTRRRSLIQTPGVATRNSPTEGRRRTWNSWKAPKLDPEEEAKWRPSTRAHIPLNRLTALDLAEEMSRAQTPGELDYSHLGSLKLGSLVVTNGAPSPAPSAKVSKENSRLAGQDDYFSAVDGDSSPLMMKTTKRRGHVKSKSSVLPTAAPFHHYLEVPTKESTTKHRKHTEAHAAPNNQSSDVVLDTVPTKPLRITNETVDTFAYDASRLAQSYQAEIPLSPFGNRDEVHRNEQDEGFVSDDALSYKEEAARMLDGTIFAEPASTIEMKESLLSSTTPRVPASGAKKPGAPRRPPPRTADSGYSSGGSLRLADREQPKSCLQPKSAQRSNSPLKGGSAPAEQSITPDMSKTNSNTTSLEPLASNTTQATQEQRRPPPLNIPDLSARSSVRSSASESVLSPQTPRSIASKASFDSTSSASRKRSQRRGQSQPELPVVQSCQPIPEGTIPEIPDNVRAKFVRRLSHTPGMECLTHTYPTKEHVLANEPASDAPPTATTVNSQLAELEPDRPPTPPAYGRRKSFSMFRKKTTKEHKEVAKEAESVSSTVVDLGTIASALGSSPYDAAISNPRTKTLTAPTHPHQLGKTLPRAKSMVNMDSEAAAEFARKRSKDRASVEQEMPQQRRKSHQNLKMEAGEARASKRRPQSSYQDIPPVPAINTSRLSVPQSARPRLETSEQQESGPDLSFSARSRERSRVVPPLVDKYEACEQSPSQDKIDWEAHSQTWSRRRKSIGEGLRTKNEFSEATASTVNSRTVSPEDMASWGRYSGGLSYGYEGRGAGVGGSAGTRSLHSTASSKSLHWRNQYGVDLSDVPVMLQRA
ncbi:Nn.00g098820.m01.CDS01 [Neocucurbitaria sp. VM-36]